MATDGRGVRIARAGFMVLAAIFGIVLFAGQFVAVVPSETSVQNYWMFNGIIGGLVIVCVGLAEFIARKG